MKSKRQSQSRRFLSIVLLFSAAVIVMFAGRAPSQPVSPAGSGSGSPSTVKPRSVAPKEEDGDSVLPWLVAGGIIVALGVGGVVAWKVIEKRPRPSSSGL